MTGAVPTDTSVAVANEALNEYKSLGAGFEDTADVRAVNDELDYPIANPLTLCLEVDVYLPHDCDGWTPQDLDADADVLVYDAYGPHGIHRLGDGFTSTAEVREWIDEELEPEAPGEYTIAVVTDE